MIKLLPEKENVFLRASLSDVCNYSCQYCAKDLGMENHTPICYKSQLLSVNDYLRNIRLISEHGFKMISFTGGEPLLNPNFSEIARQCKKMFDTVEITTNGSKVLDYIDIIKEYIDVLKISIDAYDPIISSRIAGNSYAEKTKMIIKECCKKGIQTIGLNFVYMKQNEEELEKLVDFSAGLKQKYGTNVYISVLDLYYSKGNREFWQEQFVNLENVRELLTKKGMELNQRIRIGCDSYNLIWKGVLVNMKDSISYTHRMDMCEQCTEYCQEGIYSLKHSASGWVSVCPNNNPNFGSLINGQTEEERIHEVIDKYVKMLNDIVRVKDTGKEFCKRNKLFYK